MRCCGEETLALFVSGELWLFVEDDVVRCCVYACVLCVCWNLATRSKLRPAQPNRTNRSVKMATLSYVM